MSLAVASFTCLRQSRSPRGKLTLDSRGGRCVGAAVLIVTALCLTLAPLFQDDRFVIGRLSKKTRKIRVVNTLTTQDDLLQVCSEETLLEIQDRYTDYNKHAGSYTWKVGAVLHAIV